MSDININDFFSLNNKVALVTGGMLSHSTVFLDQYRLTMSKVPEDLVYMLLQRFFWLVQRQSSLLQGRLAENRESTRLLNVSMTSPLRKD